MREKLSADADLRTISHANLTGNVSAETGKGQANFLMDIDLAANDVETLQQMVRWLAAERIALFEA